MMEFPSEVERVLTVCSGGMDSVTLAYFIDGLGLDQQLVSFDYGQRHRKELHFAARAGRALDVEHTVVDLSGLALLLSGSALTDEAVPVPLGHYAADSMRATVVPNRNAIMISVATGIAVARGLGAVALGMHAGDHPIYPDCRPGFVEIIDLAMRTATEGFAAPGFAVVAPFVEMSKADIAAAGAALGVPYADTWSCYQGGELHCGACGTCTERREAFALAGVEDPTTYAVNALL